MSYEVKFLPAAALEFNERVDWYEDRQVGLGNRYIAAVDYAIEEIVKAPSRSTCVY